MARKHLRDLLVEDQEPFLLDAYISDRRRQLNKPPRPLVHRKSASFGENLLKNANACFSSSSFRYHGSKHSPSLPPRANASAARVQAKTAGNNTVLLRVPTRTAAMLLEAALKIESYGLKDCDPPDRKKQGKSGEVAGTGESLFRKFTRFGRRSRKKEFQGCEGDDGVLVRDILGLDKYGQQQKQGKAKANNSSITSKKPSSYADKCPCRKSETLDAHMYEPEQIRGRESFGGSEGTELGRSPIRYPTPELWSPMVASPTHSFPMVYQAKANEEESDPREVRLDKLEEEEEEEVEVEKEQSSPVSVLDPHSYHDYNVRVQGYAEDPDDNDGYENAYHSVDYEAMYTMISKIVSQKLKSQVGSNWDFLHRIHGVWCRKRFEYRVCLFGGTKQELLQKLYMFERLAGLDPVELEEQTIGQDDSQDEDEDRDARPERGGDDSSRRMGVTRGMMKQVSYIVLMEQKEVKNQGDHGRVDMAIQGYYRQNGMARREEVEDHLEGAAEEIEASILGFLVEELSEELRLHRCL